VSRGQRNGSPWPLISDNKEAVYDDVGWIHLVQYWEKWRDVVTMAMNSGFHKLVRLIKMCLHKTYSKIRVDKNLSDKFPIQNGLRQGDALSPLLLTLL
jgi:hypothetical protein